MQCYKNSLGSKIKAAELCLSLFLKTCGQHSVLYALDVIAIAPNKNKNKQKTRRSSHTFLACLPTSEIWYHSNIVTAPYRYIQALHQQF